MANKLQNIIDIQKEAVPILTSNIDVWTEFLESASYNYKYSFNDQVLIYVQKPDATAVATMEIWNKKLHRWIKKGSKGIALVRNNGSYNYLEHVFDLADTYNGYGTDYTLWQVNPNYDNEIIETLENRFGTLENKETLANAIISAANNYVEDNIQDYFIELQDSINDSKLKELDENTLKDTFKTLVKNSVSYMMLKRANFIPSRYISEFPNIEKFNNIETISKLGITISDIAKTGILEIYRAERSLENNYKNKIRTFDKVKNQNYNEINKEQNNNFNKGGNRDEWNSKESDLSSRGGLPNTRPNIGETEQNSIGQVREYEVGLHQGEQERILYGANDERNINESSSRSRQDSSKENRPNNSRISSRESSEREDESTRPNEMGSNDEQLSKSSRGDSASRSSLQLNLFTNNKTEEEQKQEIKQAEVLENDTSAFLMPENDDFEFTDEIITSVLLEGSYFEEGKFRIEKQFEESLSSKENIEFLKKEYGIGGASSFDGFSDIGINYASKGIELNKGLKENSPRKLYSWNEIEKRISDLVRNDKYLSKEEKKQYQKWLDPLSNINNIESKKDNRTLEERLLEFETEYDIFDTSDEDNEYQDNPRIIDDIEKDLSTTETLKNYIDYYNQILESEDDEKSEINQKLKGFISEMNNLLSEKEKMPKTENKDNENDLKVDIPKENFKITDNHLGEGTPKEKYQNNINAIKLLHTLEDENRNATHEEQEILSKYVGWGGLADYFDENKHPTEFKKLKELLTEEEYKNARSSSLTAFYTPPIIIKAIYQALENMGVQKANILEPSCGTGNFFGMIPDDLSNSKLYGIELDSITGRIAQKLYPNANIKVQGYEKADLPDSFFDVAIGNVPFGDFKVSDKRYDKNNFLIHDYFFAKTLDKVRPRRNYSFCYKQRNYG